MKTKIINTTILILAILINTKMVFSQVSIEEANKYISIFYTQQYDQSTPQKAIQEKGSKIGIFLPYIALKFNTGVSSYKHFSAGLTPNSAYAMLDIDTTVFQEITDEFYKRFTERFSATSIRIVDFETVKNSSIYMDLAAQPITERYFRDVWSGESSIYTQQNSPIISLPNNPSPKMSKWMNSLKATPCVIRLVIDFMEYEQLLIEGKEYTSQKVAENSVVPVIKIASSDERDHTLINFYEGSKTSLTSDKVKMHDVAPGFQMGGYMNANLYFHNKSIYESYKPNEIVNLKNDNLPGWASSLNNKYNKEINNDKFERLAVKIDREEYKRAVLEALDKYIEYIVSVIKFNQKK